MDPTQTCLPLKVSIISIFFLPRYPSLCSFLDRRRTELRLVRRSKVNGTCDFFSLGIILSIFFSRSIVNSTRTSSSFKVSDTSNFFFLLISVSLFSKSTMHSSRTYSSTRSEWHFRLLLLSQHPFFSSFFMMRTNLTRTCSSTESTCHSRMFYPIIFTFFLFRSTMESTRTCSLTESEWYSTFSLSIHVSLSLSLPFLIDNGPNLDLFVDRKSITLPTSSFSLSIILCLLFQVDDRSDSHLFLDRMWVTSPTSSSAFIILFSFLLQVNDGPNSHLLVDWK